MLNKVRSQLRLYIPEPNGFSITYLHPRETQGDDDFLLSSSRGGVGSPQATVSVFKNLAIDQSELASLKQGSKF